MKSNFIHIKEKKNTTPEDKLIFRGRVLFLGRVWPRVGGVTAGWVFERNRKRNATRGVCGADVASGFERVDEAAVITIDSILNGEKERWESRIMTTDRKQGKRFNAGKLVA